MIEGPTGMDHVVSTQENYYDNRQAQAGIRNKQIARRDITEIAFNMLESDEEHDEMIREEEVEHHRLAVLDNEIRLEEEEYVRFCKDVSKRTAKKKILSWEKVEILKSIYICDDPEWSCLFLCGECPPNQGHRMDSHFLRYITHTGPNMPAIRRIFGNIAKTFPKEVPYIKFNNTSLSDIFIRH